MANIKPNSIIKDSAITWREFFKGDYLSYYDLIGGDEVVTIREMRYETVTGPGGKKDDKLVAYFESPDTLPMVMNVTNSKTITNMYKTAKPAEWVGKSVILYADKSVTRGGEQVGGIRIRPEVPRKKTLTAERFSGMVEAIKAKKFTKERAYEFSLTPEQKAQIDAI